MKKRLTKMLAVLMAATMMLGGAMTVFADTRSDGLTGDGTFEGTAEMEVFDVVLPTYATTDMFDFILDPEGLIAETGNDRYTGKKFATDASLYFNVTPTSANDNLTHDDVTDKLVVKNKGNVKLDVTLTAELTNTDITLTNDKTFGGGTDTEKTVYLALVTAADEQAMNPTDSKAVLTATVDAVAETNFETIWDDDEEKYVHQMKYGVADTEWKTFEFWMTGACNTNADWDGYTGAPTMDVTWEIKTHEEDREATGITDEITLQKVSASSPDWVINFDLGAGDKKVTPTTITFKNVAGKNNTWTVSPVGTEGANVTISADGKLTIKSDLLIGQFNQMKNNSYTKPITYTINLAEGQTAAADAVLTFQLQR